MRRTFWTSRLQKSSREEEITNLRKINADLLEAERIEAKRRCSEIRLEFEKERECHREELHELATSKDNEILEQKRRFEFEWSQARENYEKELEQQKQELEGQLVELRLEYDREKEFRTEEIKILRKISHEQELISLREEFDKQLQDLKSEHEKDIAMLKSDIELKHMEYCDQLEEKYRLDLDTIKFESPEKDNSFTYTSQSPEIMAKEIESLRYVVDLRIKNIKELNKELAKYQLMCEELNGVQNQNLSLQAKVEDLEAQLEKSRQDKSIFIEKLQMSESNLKLFETENDRLHLHNEELKWRIQNLNSEQRLVQSNYVKFCNLLQ